MRRIYRGPVQRALFGVSTGAATGIPTLDGVRRVRQVARVEAALTVRVSPPGVAAGKPALHGVGCVGQVSRVEAAVTVRGDDVSPVVVEAAAVGVRCGLGGRGDAGAGW